MGAKPRYRPFLRNVKHNPLKQAPNPPRTVFLFMQVFWLTDQSFFFTFPKQSFSGGGVSDTTLCLKKSAPRIQRRDRAGLSPASLLAAGTEHFSLPAEHEISTFYTISRPRPCQARCGANPADARKISAFCCQIVVTSGFPFRIIP